MSPRDTGRLELIVRRPAVDQREAPSDARLDLVEGLVGDTWITRGSRHTPDGSSLVDSQITVMNIRAAALVAGSPERRQLAGDQLYVDLDLSMSNLPPGTQLRIGEALIEVMERPHTGCDKFRARFGREALRLVNSPLGREHRLRGLNSRVIEPGVVRLGDAVCKEPVIVAVT
jgi:hypothetical protein